MFKKFIAFVVAFFHFATFAGAATLKFEYDQAGNMISGQGRYYEYNDANQLVKVRKDAPSGPVIAEYVYDYQGQRVKKIENGITTYYIGKHYEERKGNTVNEKTNYIFVNGQRVAASIKKDNEPAKISYYLNNHLGSADVIVDEQGNVTDKIRYYPYGEYRTQPNAQRHTYTGKERDEATEQYYYEARYYNPFIRRFTQADTITPNLYDPQSLNRYAYTRNNPVKYVDPSGHFFDVVLDIAFIANDIKTLVTDPSSRTVVNYLALGADVLGVVLPGATGLGAGVKAAVAIGAKKGLVGLAVAGIKKNSFNAVEKLGKEVDVVKTISLSKKKYGEAAEHIQDAQKAGYPEIVTIDRKNAISQRKDAIGGMQKVSNKQLDEYPPAMFTEGGKGASVRAINPKDNMAAGACIGNSCRGLSDGNKVRIKVTD